jgi:hypothetical protein
MTKIVELNGLYILVKAGASSHGWFEEISTSPEKA